jgi:hypothetical protein
VEKLIAAHRVFTALGAALGMLGIGLGSAHPAHLWLVAAGGAIGTFGAELARAWNPGGAK